MADTVLFWIITTVGLVSGAAFFTCDARRYPAEPMYKWLPLLGWVLLILGLPFESPWMIGAGAIALADAPQVVKVTC